MSDGLYINGKEAWSTYRIRMGNGFLDALEADADNRDYITNVVRTENGTRVVPVRPLVAERNVTLEFVIVGRNHEDYNQRMAVFNNLLANGFMTLQVSKSKEDIYRLYCSRKSTSYSRGAGGAIGKKSVRFIEFNPTDRGALKEEEKAMFNLTELKDYR